ncbi:hypothetical protein OIU77_006982 [Salix suchowensis]|uniref:Uncharacterized protein n=1 Tax=Salix suchowensis TaxID=1278906 RepID=A0ABQ9AMP7_9ROSI|nr:hypothetical protein OIU77_006982 [Salix suchowensis]
MARFLLITYALEQTLVKLGSFGFEEIGPSYRLDRSVKALKEVLPSVQAFIQDTKERVVAALHSRDFLDLQEHVDSIENSLYWFAIFHKIGNLYKDARFLNLSTDDRRGFFDGRTVNLRISSYLESVLELPNRISHSLKEIRSNKQ